jgi:hypothetical protein
MAKVTVLSLAIQGEDVALPVTSLAKIEHSDDVTQKFIAGTLSSLANAVPQAEYSSGP